jgi:hypothetical protein
MADTLTAREQQVIAEQFVTDNLTELCQELVAFNDTGLFGTGKAHELRQMCGFAGASAQSLAIGMVEMAAVRAVAAPSQTVQYTLVAKWLGFAAPELREKFVAEFKEVPR